MGLDDEQKRRAPLRLKVLKPSQRQLWKELSGTPAQFTLYGGTALALQLGHRASVDFDFFSSDTFDSRQLLTSVPYLAGARIVQQTPDTLTVVANRGGDVNVSFFAPPQGIQAIGNTLESRQPRLRIASKIDIAATKLAAIPVRPAAKDYVDVHALIKKGKIDLTTQLAAVPFVFPAQDFNPYVVLKALAYFGDGDLPNLPERVRRELEQAVAAVDLSDVERRIAAARENPDVWKGLP